MFVIGKGGGHIRIEWHDFVARVRRICSAKRNRFLDRVVICHGLPRDDVRFSVDNGFILGKMGRAMMNHQVVSPSHQSEMNPYETSG
ncbi:MAG: hypothetical protein KatS3mg110_2770 [Pirellulaceae bacterium]|nr:MAG: hypothetical protein KatS3mg110_2770 [Pirellulaceae bacterium]